MARLTKVSANAQAGTLRAFPPAGMQMMLALWGIFTFCMFLQTLVMNVALQARQLPPVVSEPAASLLRSAGLFNAVIRRRGDSLSQWICMPTQFSLCYVSDKVCGLSCSSSS